MYTFIFTKDFKYINGGDEYSINSINMNVCEVYTNFKKIRINT